MRGYLRTLAGLIVAGLLLAGLPGTAAQATPGKPHPAAAQDVGRGGTVATTSWKDGRFDVYRLFYEGNAATVRLRTFDGARWSPWIPIGGPFYNTAGISALSSTYSRIDIFVVGTTTPTEVQRTLFHRYFDGHWSGWEQLGTGYIDYAPDVVSPSPDRIDVVGRKPGGDIGHRSFVVGRGWGPWEDLGFRSWGGPHAISRTAGSVDIVQGDSEVGVSHVYGTDGQWQSTQIEPPSSSEHTSYADTAGLVPFPYGNEQPRALLYSWRHNVDKLYLNIYNGYWHGSDWVPYSDVLYWNSPVVGTSWDKRADLFSKGKDGYVYHSAMDLAGTGGDSRWQSLGGPQNISTTPVVTSWAPGHIELFVVDGSAVLHHISYKNGTWGAWEAL
ncbi:hypothetical protein [Actinoallomurus sp. CA-150999]|uniref:hypothetical protein n=1 Tax=Actinoallomurus sp. CA-150999 TaxID=3239887 RepID=UPI003D8B1E23